jgi:exodeoxyribonuclease VII large subunit
MMPMTGTNRQIISVSALNRDAKRLLESEFPVLYVEGEISNFARPGSGHWYFTLKDAKAQIRCAMFRNRNQLVRFEPKNGQQVIVRGRISLYEGRGEFQMIAEFLEDSGDGALRRAYEKLKDQLQNEGLFDASRKAAIPEVPNHVAIITSPSGAAIRDVISVMQRRFPAVHISILPVLVQGDSSVPQIVEAIEFANRYAADPFDLILLTRGGGSLEDLWSFNTEPVARAIDASKLPIVSAIGHESDVSIADFVADLRAPTPSAAAELITPDGSVWLDEFQEAERRLTQITNQLLEENRREVIHLSRRLRHPRSHLAELSQRIDEVERRLSAAMRNTISKNQSSLNQHKLTSPAQIVNNNTARLLRLQEKLLANEVHNRKRRASELGLLVSKLDTLSPLATLQRGYAIVSTEDGHIVTEANTVKTGDKIQARLQHGHVIAEVTEVAEVTQRTES